VLKNLKIYKYKLNLVSKLIKEIGKYNFNLLIIVTFISSICDLIGIGILVSIFLQGIQIPFSNFSLNIDLKTSAILITILIILKGFLRVFTITFINDLKVSFSNRIKQDLLRDTLCSKDIYEFEVSRGDLLSLLMIEINRSVNSIDQLISLIQNITLQLIYSFGIIFFGKEKSIILILALLTTLLSAYLIKSESWKLGNLQTSLNSSWSKTLGDGLHGLKNIRSASSESWLIKKFYNENLLYQKISRILVIRRNLFNVIREISIVLVVFIWFIIVGKDLENSEIATTIILTYKLSQAASAAIRSQRLFLTSLPGYEKLLNVRSKIDNSKSKIASISTTFENKYQKTLTSIFWKNKLILKNFKQNFLYFERGQIIAITGTSGAGKTKLLDSICGLTSSEHSLWELKSLKNKITIDSNNSSVLLENYIGYCPQKTVLFEGNIISNLLMKNDKEIQNSSEIVKDWINKLYLSKILKNKKSLNTQLNLSVDCFSGGEIQRLGLIRTWLRDKPIELLDEPTSMLDKELKELVKKIIIERSKNKITFIVTHDESLIKAATFVIKIPFE
tara:strand:- start:150 stop:1835 length:1686 start_codon:yes stop_codon:yes gene_type:complete